MQHVKFRYISYNKKHCKNEHSINSIKRRQVANVKYPGWQNKKRTYLLSYMSYTYRITWAKHTRLHELHIHDYMSYTHTRLHELRIHDYMSYACMITLAVHTWLDDINTIWENEYKNFTTYVRKLHKLYDADLNGKFQEFIWIIWITRLQNKTIFYVSTMSQVEIFIAAVNNGICPSHRNITSINFQCQIANFYSEFTLWDTRIYKKA